MIKIGLIRVENNDTRTAAAVGQIGLLFNMETTASGEFL